MFFKGDLNHRKLTYDCAAPASTPFDVAIGPMASSAGAPKIASLRTIKSDVVVGLGSDGNMVAENLDAQEPGWKISGKYVCHLMCLTTICTDQDGFVCRLWCSFLKAAPERKFALHSSTQFKFNCTIRMKFLTVIQYVHWASRLDFYYIRLHGAKRMLPVDTHAFFLLVDNWRWEVAITHQINTEAQIPIYPRRVLEMCSDRKSARVLS